MHSLFKKGILIYGLGLILTMISCSSNKGYKQLVEGNWKTPNMEKSLYVPREITLSFFNDSSCIYLRPYHDYLNYSVTNDTLIINDKVTLWKENDHYDSLVVNSFKIKKVTKDSLELKPIAYTQENLLENVRRTTEQTIVFHKIQPKVSFNFDKIAYYSTVCFGSCPAVYMELDAKGNMTFESQRFALKEGWYTGMLSSEDKQAIQELAASINWDKLKPHYAATYTDAASQGVLIQIDGKTYKTSVYGSADEPVELQLLFYVLQHSYNRAKLKFTGTEDLSIALPDFHDRK